MAECVVFFSSYFVGFQVGKKHSIDVYMQDICVCVLPSYLVLQVFDCYLSLISPRIMDLKTDHLF